MNLLDKTTELYWSFEQYGIDDRRRMKAVLYEIAAEILSWAPPAEHDAARCLVTSEIANRIIRECNDSDAKREEVA